MSHMWVYNVTHGTVECHICKCVCSNCSVPWSGSRSTCEIGSSDVSHLQDMYVWKLRKHFVTFVNSDRSWQYIRSTIQTLSILTKYSWYLTRPVQPVLVTVLTALLTWTFRSNYKATTNSCEHMHDVRPNHFLPDCSRSLSNPRTFGVCDNNRRDVVGAIKTALVSHSRCSFLSPAASYERRRRSLDTRTSRRTIVSDSAVQTLHNIKQLYINIWLWFKRKDCWPIGWASSLI